MEKQNISFFVMCIALLFVGISFIFAVFELSGYAFAFELGILLIFIFFIAFAMVAAYHDKSWGWAVTGVILILILLDSILVSFLAKRFENTHLIAILFSIIGFVTAIINIRTSNKDDDSSNSKAEEYYPQAEKIEPVEKIEPEEPKKETETIIEALQEVKAEEEKPEIEVVEIPEIKKEIKIKPKKAIRTVKTKRAKTKRILAKFVASAETKRFHTAKCGWARIMKRKNRIYFNSRRKAERAGFKAHECVK